MWVALDGERVVGTVTYVEPGSALVEVSRDGEAEMRSLAVDPAATGRGIGETLARHVIDRAANGASARWSSLVDDDARRAPALRAARVHPAARPRLVAGAGGPASSPTRSPLTD